MTIGFGLCHLDFIRHLTLVIRHLGPNMNVHPPYSCCSPAHFSRRGALAALGLSGIGWLTPLAERLARSAEDAPRGKPAKSLIGLWVSGGARPKGRSCSRTGAQNLHAAAPGNQSAGSRN